MLRTPVKTTFIGLLDSWRAAALRRHPLSTTPMPAGQQRRTSSQIHLFDQNDSAENGYTRRVSDSWDEQELQTLPQHLRPIRGETLDLILRHRIYLLQSRRGYRANVDSHILAHFASDVCNRALYRPGRQGLRVLDLGAGNGLVSILFARWQGSCSVTMVELQPQLADRARRNMELNEIPGTVIQHDLKGGDLPTALHDCFDVILINPPFYPVGSRSPPRRKEKFLAHMETTATFSDFLRAARLACDSRNSEAFVAVIHDVKELLRLRNSIEENQLEPGDSREMLHTLNEEASRILLQLVPKGRRLAAHSGNEPDVAENGESNPVMGNWHIPSLSPVILHPNHASYRTYTSEIEDALERLPLPSLRIGRLRDVT